MLISVVLSLILLLTSHSPSPDGGLASEGFFRCFITSLGGCLHLLLPQPLPDRSEPILCWKHDCVAAVLCQGHSFYHWHLLTLPAAQLLLCMAKMSTQNCCPCWKARLWQASPIFDFSILLRDCNVVSILRWKSSPSSSLLFPHSWILLDIYFFFLSWCPCGPLPCFFAPASSSEEGHLLLRAWFLWGNAKAGLSFHAFLNITK